MTAHENSTYIVQRLEPSTDGEGERWQDIGTVVISTRQRRSSAIKAAVENAYGAELSETLMVRVLDASSAHVYAVRAKQQTTLEIG